MNRNTLLTVAVIGLVAYFLLRKPKEAKEIGQSPEDAGTNKTVEGVDAGTKAQTTATLKAKGVRVPKKRRVLLEEIVVPKEPIVIPPSNLIPNVYSRGVNQPLPIEVSANGERYFNMSGTCSENIQTACKCTAKTKERYKLDIPNID
jgi:hypothetical protein